jgi:flavocytochrome c
MNLLYPALVVLVLSVVLFPGNIRLPLYSSKNSSMSKVVVIGGGLAGFSAAIECLRSSSCSVTLLDKEPRCGGNSGKASSGMNAVYTPPQEHMHVVDNEDMFTRDTIKSGEGRSNTTLVNTLVHESRAAWDFISSFGVNLTEVSQCGGHSAPRTHRNPDDPASQKVVNVGWAIMSTLIESLQKAAQETGRAQIINNAEAVRLLSQDGTYVSGVQYRNTQTNEIVDLPADAVVLATGGFGGDLSESSMVFQYAPQLKGFATTNGAFARGDGIKMGTALGGALVDMDQVQTHPTGFINLKEPAAPTKFLAPEALRAVGGILVNSDGNRFVDELGTRKHVSQAILAQNEWPSIGSSTRVAAIILSASAAKEFSERVLNFYGSMLHAGRFLVLLGLIIYVAHILCLVAYLVLEFGLVQTASDLAQLAEKLHVDKEVLQNTLASYSQAAAAGKDEFGKSLFRNVPSLEGPYCMFHISLGPIRTS